MEARQYLIKTFMAANKTIFAIPVYQRNYNWEFSHCKRLLEDIEKVGRDASIGGHFIGSIVFVHDGVYSSSGPTELTVIDGQQRLTTLTLIYAVLYRYALMSGRPDLAEEIYETYLINKFAPETEKLKLKPTENNKEALRRVLEDQTDDYPEYSRIIENYKFFKSRINDGNFEFIRRGIDKLIFVEISLELSKDNPQRIFESLNSTGLDLSQADLIRNYILMGLSRTDQEKIYTTYWEVIEKNAWDDHLKESRVSEFIRDYLTLKNKEIPTQKNVYATFKNQFPTTTLFVLKDILSDLTSLSKCYGKLINPSLEADRSVSKHLAYFKQLDTNVAYPFLMQVYADYVDSQIDRTVFIAVLELVQSYVWRRFIVGLPTNALSKVFMGLYEKIDPADYLYSAQKSLLERSGTARFPTDLEVETALREKDVYNIKPKNRVYLFERLEHHENRERVSIDSDITTEHIFPQNPDSDWETDLSFEECLFIRENYLHTIGNLTLSRNNGSLGNRPFLEKRDMNVDGKRQGYRFSSLWLNEDLKEKEQWNRVEIEDRTKRLTKRFLAVWKRPEIVINETVESTEISIFEADDPTHKRLEYAIFFDQKITLHTVTELYVFVMKQLSERHPEMFFSAAIKMKIGLVSNPQNMGNIQYEKLNDTYFLLTKLSNVEKFKRLKVVLKELDCEEELVVKFA